MTEEEAEEAVRAAAMVAAVRAALHSPHVSIHLVQTLSLGQAVQVKIKTRKIGPLIFPPEGGTVGGVLAMLGAMYDES